MSRGLTSKVGWVSGTALFLAGAQAMGRADSHVPNRLLVGFRAETTPDAALSAIGKIQGRSAKKLSGLNIHMVDVPAGQDLKTSMRILRANPQVKFAELDRILEPDEVNPNDTYYASMQWGLKKTSCNLAWDTTVGSSSIVIAILDSGVNASHPDLAGKLVPGRNIYNNNTDTADVYGHGTKVAGTAGASANNAMGVASPAWNCMIMPVRVSSSTGGASLSALAQGLTWAADNGARVANMSYAASDSSTVSSAAQYFMSKGGVVCASSGNDGTYSTAQDNPYILTVGGSDNNDLIFSWSTRGRNLDLVAPGSTYTTTMAGGYSSASGTSYASPFVCGVAGLVLSVNPGLTGAEAQQIVRNATDDLFEAGWDNNSGNGRINALKAVQAAQAASNGDTQAPTITTLTPANGSAVSGSVALTATAEDNTGVQTLEVFVNGTLFGSAAGGSFQQTWDTAGLANGAHTVEVVAKDAAGNQTSAESEVIVDNGTADTTAPTISITSPSGGSMSGSEVSVSVQATDDTAVVKVELYVDGKLTATSLTAPFTTSFNPKRLKAGSHTVQTKAYDAAGNSSWSQVVTLTK